MTVKPTLKGVTTDVYRATVTNLVTWPGIAARYVGRLARPTAEKPAPPYRKCAACERGGRDDQHVPDPDQFTTKKGVTPAGDVVGNAATVPAEDGTAVKLIDAPPVWCAGCRNWFHAIQCYSLHRHN